MRFIKENIEELIFDYHEGNLSDAEKTEVLNLIHQYPEYESDFILLAQTYAHVDEQLPDYGITSALLQNPVPWYNSIWLKSSIISACVFVGLLLYFYPDKQPEKKSFPVEKPVPPLVQKGQSIESGSGHKSIPAPDFTAEKQTTAIVVHEPSVSGAGAEHILESEKPLAASGHTIEHTHPGETKIVEKAADVVADTVKTSGAAKTSGEENKKDQKNKKRDRNGLNIIPESKFIPVNTDF